MNVLLLQPLIPKERLWGAYAVEGGIIPPIGLLSIAAYLESKRHKVRILDCIADKYSEDDLKKYLEKEIFDVVGIPIFTNTAADTYHTAKLVKNFSPDSKVVLGGVHATIMPERTMQECSEADYLVVGEGEFTMEELLRQLSSLNPEPKDIRGLVFRNQSGDIAVNGRRELIPDINVLPLPAYHLVDMSKYIPHPTQYKVLPSYPVIFQRGCPFDCAFCGARSVHGRIVRHKTVENLVAEIEHLIDRYGARGIHFQDSTFTVNKKYVTDFCNEIIRRGINIKWDINTRVDCLDEELIRLMKKAGLWMINLGLESGNQQSLDILNKRTRLNQIENAISMIRRERLVSFSTWILGIPGENEEMVKNTIRFAKRIGTELALFFLPVPYPGTALMEICRREGGLRDDIRWEDYSAVDFSRPVYVNPLIGEEKMKKLLKSAFIFYYINPKILWRNLTAIDSVDDLKRYWRGFRAWAGGCLS